MCSIGEVRGVYNSEKPIVGYKVFSRASDNVCDFTIARGSVPRGEWRRFDDVIPYPRNKGGCSDFKNGFHAFVRSADAHEVADRTDQVYLPVELKGEITVSNQEGIEILVGEWMYVPSVQELKAL